MSEVEVLGGLPQFSLDEVRGVVAAACRRVGAERAILFGSYARGTADAHSDLDILIVCETEHSVFERMHLFDDVLEAFPGADLLIYRPVEFEEMQQRAGVVGEAVREGVVLYDARPGSAETA